MFAAGMPSARRCSTTGRMSSLFVAIVWPFCPAMPLTLIATLSSLWTKRPNAFAMSVSPVSSVIARSSICRAASTFGQRPLSWRVFAFVTLTIFPGAAKGVKPGGGVAASDGLSSASAGFASASVEARAAEVPRNPRRETVLIVTSGLPRPPRQGKAAPPLLGVRVGDARKVQLASPRRLPLHLPASPSRARNQRATIAVVSQRSQRPFRVTRRARSRSSPKRRSAVSDEGSSSQARRCNRKG